MLQVCIELKANCSQATEMRSPLCLVLMFCAAYTGSEGLATTNPETPLEVVEKEVEDVQELRKDEMLSSLADATTPVGTGTTTYIRWGRKDCETITGTSLIYRGYAAGGWYNENGNGVGPICLPAPDFQPLEYNDFVQPGLQSLGGMLYGAEYQTNYFQHLSERNNYNIPCALCEVNGRTSTLMLPGLKSCPNGWTEEYHGYLMSNRYNYYSQTQYTCVDEHMKGLKGTKANNNGLLLYTIEIANHPSLCPPFDCSGKELSCAVCTK